MPPSVTIIIGVYNGEKYLAELLDSILAQTQGDWKCICVNDGSSDGSATILKAYAERDTRFHIISQENGGVGSARNTALGIVDTPYVMFADQDDTLKPNAVERAIEAIKQSKSDIVRFNSSRMVKKSPFVWERVYRRASIGDVRFPPITGGEDTAFLWELSLKGLVETQIPDLLYVNRAHGKSFSRRVQPTYIANVFDGFDAMWLAGLKYGKTRAWIRRKLFPHVFWFSASIVAKHPTPANLSALIFQFGQHISQWFGGKREMSPRATRTAGKRV